MDCGGGFRRPPLGRVSVILGGHFSAFFDSRYLFIHRFLSGERFLLPPPETFPVRQRSFFHTRPASTGCFCVNKAWPSACRLPSGAGRWGRREGTGATTAGGPRGDWKPATPSPERRGGAPGPLDGAERRNPGLDRESPHRLAPSSMGHPARVRPLTNIIPNPPSDAASILPIL